MAENKKLEEIVDLLADYGGFDRDYLKDKLLNSNRKKSDNKNKMQQVAALFGKKLGEEFSILTPIGKFRKVKFTADRGLLFYDCIERGWHKNYAYLDLLSRGRVVIVYDK